MTPNFPAKVSSIDSGRIVVNQIAIPIDSVI